MHYRVRFENTGSAPAQNIVVRIPIDQQRFQLNSLQLLSASHGVRATVRDSIAEFVFRNINLDSGGHGNVLLKIRSSQALQPGDAVINGAGIYFDYNFPIQTNEAETVFQDLSTANPDRDESVIVYPNPASGVITIASAHDIEKIEVYDVHGRLLQVSHAWGREVVLKLTDYASGSYFIRILTDKGSSVQKILKQ
ncbi:MAG: T9SS type A sorting domain-containing protein [Chitinophagaceae bacterium]|nr:MAG: T9SS type A sorting domain-containing protein [Chitinophagaceae bacterium]